MKKVILVSTLLILNFFNSANASPTKNEATLFQIATITSLAQGVFDGDFSYGKLMQHGDFGIGTFTGVDGEMVAVDGKFYQMNPQGKMVAVTKNQTSPFAEVIFFKPIFKKEVNSLKTEDDFSTLLLSLIKNKNIPHAVRIDGTFKSLKLRNLPKQQPPYPVLTKVTANQEIFNPKDVKGTLVGFWFPEYLNNLGVAGLHVHFISDDHQIGGHVLEMDLEKGKLSIEPINQIQVHLPDTKNFAQADLTAKNLQDSIKDAEGS